MTGTDLCFAQMGEEGFVVHLADEHRYGLDVLYVHEERRRATRRTAATLTSRLGGD